MTLIPVNYYIYAFQINPFVVDISNYTINLTDTLNSSDFIITSGVIINDLLCILTDDF